MNKDKDAIKREYKSTIEGWVKEHIVCGMEMSMPMDIKKSKIGLYKYHVKIIITGEHEPTNPVVQYFDVDEEYIKERDKN